MRTLGATVNIQCKDLYSWGKYSLGLVHNPFQTPRTSVSSLIPKIYQDCSGLSEPIVLDYWLSILPLCRQATQAHENGHVYHQNILRRSRNKSQ